jgi:hypothetical protein
MLLGLIAIWAISMIFGFSLVQWGLSIPLVTPKPPDTFVDHLYFSGVTFFTLGYGDVVPGSTLGRALAVLEAGLGFGFLALVIAYIPVIYAAFSRREVQMLLLDSKAGSEPTATELLRRHADAGVMHELTALLKEWERFAAELLESYLSYPTLAYYRSQHDDQSWLRSLTAIMDTCALIESTCKANLDWTPSLRFQAKATFQMGRHVIVDLAYILDAEPMDPDPVRLPPDSLTSMFRILGSSGVYLDTSEAAEAKLHEIRALYEPFVCGLSKELLMDLPVWISAEHVKDNWETTAWDGVKHF